ncbi:isocitrate lyase/PEP mutase family protein [Comamonas endophytica]|uniref:Oxaloacetate decarboxylase n=1 Tax=Comamonas endophytica TaxID=2949090 RepID=A0ABY6GEF7_9BURK|nr:MULTISPECIES: oxaloacetate decarboxylase [unclassified Acidovorax]MCD2513164.1 oxaloacetate decarboxylase [Acidovorax sp. D4N7]UYG53486.1 oxaloacetate decarboxylase [Acidovorax sp. 5MLIR]
MKPALPLSLAYPSNRNARFRELLKGEQLVSAPGAFECLTARLVEKAGFPAVYVTGSGVSISRLGAPDVAVISFAEQLDQVHRIADVVDIPVIADADTGYGGPLNVMRTVREFEKAGVSAIQIEDQDWPKKCGHEPGRRVVETQVMVDRIRAAVDTRHDANFAIVARTDARTNLGIDAALERACAYAEAGADVIFVESPESKEEMQRITRTLPVPTLANLVEGGRTPILDRDTLLALGYRVAIYPNSLTRLIGRMGQRMLQSLQETGTTASMSGDMLDHRELWDLFDYDAWTSAENRYR